MRVVTCPTNVTGLTCSGHGVCWDMASLAADAGELYGSSALSRSTVAWDYSLMMGCLCNSSWAVGFGPAEYQLGEYFQPDCSMSKSLALPPIISDIPCVTHRTLPLGG